MLFLVYIKIPLCIRVINWSLWSNIHGAYGFRESDFQNIILDGKCQVYFYISGVGVYFRGYSMRLVNIKPRNGCHREPKLLLVSIFPNIPDTLSRR